MFSSKLAAGVCASLHIAKSLELPAMDIAVKLKLVPGLVEDWKMTAVWGWCKDCTDARQSPLPRAEPGPRHLQHA
jgi:hypothetical protein